MKLKRVFCATVVALCLAGAAFLSSAAAQSRSNSRKPAASVVTKPAPTPVTVQPAPAPTPAKANSRPDGEQPAQASAPQASTATTPAAARYYYEFTQPDFYLKHVQIEHDATGRGQVTFERKSDGEAYTEPLEIAPAALARIMSAWAALDFLNSTEDYQAERQMAHLGTIRLRMTEGARARTAEFNWTHNQQAAALMNEYRRLADQQLFVFEVNIARQYQPSDTVKLLKGLESLVDRGGISDGPQLAVLLNDLSTDERIPLIARNQAARLIKKLKK
jgi:hypothetical protein